jgi:hypothetical protein
LILDELKSNNKYEKRMVKKIFDSEENGFKSYKFHELCDFKENLLILIENTENERFGGFTSLYFD